MNRSWALLVLVVAVVVYGCAAALARGVGSDPDGVQAASVPPVGAAFVARVRPVFDELLRIDAFLSSLGPKAGRVRGATRARLLGVRGRVQHAFRAARIRPVGAAQVRAYRLLSDIGWREIEVAELHLAGHPRHAAAYERGAEGLIARARAILEARSVVS